MNLKEQMGEVYENIIAVEKRISEFKAAKGEFGSILAELDLITLKIDQLGINLYKRIPDAIDTLVLKRKELEPLKMKNEVGK
jgi:hypothetical protein